MFTFSPKSIALQKQLYNFMEANVYPEEQAYQQQLHQAESRFSTPPIMKKLKEKAKKEGIWNLFIPTSHAQFSEHGGLSFLDYAPLQK
jgi:acyl-CoA dehydrogenase